MNFLIADTFTDSLAKLSGDEQKAVKITTFDLQTNPSNPGLQFHKLDKARDKRFWSVRVNADLRIIVHRGHESFLVCYVDHHDAAYQWGERRKLETHPATGAAQLVEVRESVQEIFIPKYVELEKPKPLKKPLFAQVAEEALSGYGVPAEWMADVLRVTEDSLLDLAEHLPKEAAEALLDLALGVSPKSVKAETTNSYPFAHPDALRRFRIMHNVEELERALEYPWEKWTIFLHPAQRQLVERDYGGPAKVSGSAGTGKTIVALHRAAYLARNHPDARVLLTTFSEPQAKMLRTKLRRLIGNEPRLGERLEVHGLCSIAQRLYEFNLGPLQLATREQVRGLLADAAQTVEGNKFSLHFLCSEWEEIVDAWQVEGWEQYRDVKRLGRKTRLPEARRLQVWEIFEQVQRSLRERKLSTEARMFHELASHYQDGHMPPFDYVVVDESQDVSVPQLRCLAAISAGKPNGLFFAGDLGQRIFQQPFSWKSLGVDIRGRSHVLRINYRTSHQIRQHADRLLGPEISDVDGNTEDRRAIQSVFNGPSPDIETFDSEEAEREGVAQWLAARTNDGLKPHEIGVFVRSQRELDRARAAVELAGLPFGILNDEFEIGSGQVSISTMHLAKGLEFRAVVVMACDDEIIPLQERIASVSDDADLQEVYDTERHLLYVACTRARDHLLVSSGGDASEFLEDLRSG